MSQEWAPLPDKVNLIVNVFTYSKMLHADVMLYTHAVKYQLKDHPRVDEVYISYCSGYPTDRVRNGAVADAKRNRHHFMLMLDDDMMPDIGLSREYRDPQAVGFFPSAIDFALSHDGPCCIGAPYTSSPPYQEVLVTKQRTTIPDLEDGLGLRLDKFTRDEASQLAGIQRVAALPTGCLLIDLRAIDVLPPPWFSYEYKDAPLNTAIASTEDTVFSRNLDWLGVPQYCHWSAWAGHHKDFVTQRPLQSPVTDIPQSIYKAIFERKWKPPHYSGATS